MAVPHPSPGVLLKLFGWFRDFAAMPARIKVLAEGASADADARLKCPSCGTGRVGKLRAVEGVGPTGNAGECDSCGTEFFVNVGAGRVVGAVKKGQAG